MTEKHFYLLIGIFGQILHFSLVLWDAFCYNNHRENLGYLNSLDPLLFTENK